ncbi:MAG: efflux RND transporter permease subunit [Methylococcaceae bacterium]
MTDDLNIPHSVQRTWLDNLVAYSLKGGLPVFFFLISFVLGAIALIYTPREEEPQIVVPMANVIISAPGLSAKQVEKQVTLPLEKILSQITGVEHIYSRSGPGNAIVTLRYFVGEDREDSLLNAYIKLQSNQDSIPAAVSNWIIKPVEVDDVPIVMLSLWSSQPDQYGDFELRRFADEITTSLQQIENTNQVSVVGGRARNINVLFDPQSMAARKTTAVEVVQAIASANQLQSSGILAANNQSVILEAGDFIRSIDQLKSLVVNLVDGLPVYLQDIATVTDGPAEIDNYSWIEFAPGHPLSEQYNQQYPQVTLSIAKNRGSNAVWVAENIHSHIEHLQQELLPPEIHIEILRDYGKTADEKVSNLVSSLGFAIFTVVVFIAVFLGWRPALVVGMAIPICYGLTLMLDMAFGYTINRVTLFALILSLGLLVDDPITGIDNIERFMRKGTGSANDRIIAAMAEIRSALLMSTVTIILAFVPLAFITGMMGPYMAPMAFNVPIAVIISTMVAFMVTPWLASKALKPTEETETSEGLLNTYRKLIGPFIATRKKAWLLIAITVVLFAATASLPVFQLVPLKLLPFDNKDEIQILIDLPEGSTLEHTAAISEKAALIARRLPEVKAIASFVGKPSPIDFNGLVRQYNYRQAVHLADIRLTLAPRQQREHNSHAVLLRLRKMLEPLNINGALIKVVEVPPGPPVMSTVVAEIYGDPLTDYQKQREAAVIVMDRLKQEPFIVEVDSTVEADQIRWRFQTDKEKAMLSGITTQKIALNLSLANQGHVAAYYNLEREANPLPITLRLAKEKRTSQSNLEVLPMKTKRSNPELPLIPLGELGEFVESIADKAIHHKNLKPVVYVTAELEGRTPVEVIMGLQADLGNSDIKAQDWQSRNFFNPGGGAAWQIPDDITIVWDGEGEWDTTIRVFRDMGLAFAFALVGIFFVMRLQTGSTTLALIIMSSIPMTVIGIMPGFWLLNQFGERFIGNSPDPVLFTATAMIGMIALAGIVIRNALILIEFIVQARNNGMALEEALLQAGATRMRPVLLTAGTTLLGNLIITLDPVFSGLAIAIIFGILASTLFTLVVVPVVYYLVYSPVEEKI